VSRETERKKVMAHFLATWNTADGKIAIQNQPFDTPSNSMFATVFLLELGTFRMSLGNTFFKRHSNTLQIDIYSPADSGTTKSRQIADRLESVYQDLVLPLSDGEFVKFGTPAARTLSLNEQRAGNLEDVWDRYLLECPFYRDQFVEN